MTEDSKLVKSRLEKLRPKLIDTSRRNPLINNIFTIRTSSFIKIVDEKPQNIIDQLGSDLNSKMTLVSLPSLEIDPADENSSEFKNAFQNAQITDELYLTKLEQINSDEAAEALEQIAIADRELKDRIRLTLDMPERQNSDKKNMDLASHALNHGINPSSILPTPDIRAVDDRYDDSKLQTLLLPDSFQAKMNKIFNTSKQYQEERGLDVVYLAIGYLKWTMLGSSQNEEFKSPLILIPVKIEREKSQSGQIYTLSQLDVPVLNPALEYKLFSEAKIDFSEVKSFFHQEKLEIEMLFTSLSQKSPQNLKWSVLREATLGVFPFQGLELYNDLDTENCDFSQFPIVRQLLVGRQFSEYDEYSHFLESEIDSDVNTNLVPHIVLNADSSQFIALLKVANGENVALEGPPGSGKSQTIVNAIANGIFSGKKILFVAQKNTALEVVLSRLQALGLDKFVLPLMGNHASSESFYRHIKRRLDINKEDYRLEIPGWKLDLIKKRKKIEKYIEIMTQLIPGTRISVHQVFGLVITNHEKIKNLPVRFRNLKLDMSYYGGDFSVSDINRISVKLLSYYNGLKNSSISENSEWYCFCTSNLSNEAINELVVIASSALNEIDGIFVRLNDFDHQVLNNYLCKDYDRIKYEITVLSENFHLKELYRFSLRSDREKFDELILKLSNNYYAFRDLVVKTNLSLNQLFEFGSVHKSLGVLCGYVDKNKKFKIEMGAFVEKRIELDKKFRILRSITAIGENFYSKYGIKLPIDKLKILIPLISVNADLLPFSDYICSSGLDESQREVLRAKQIYRSLRKILLRDEPPEFSVVKELRDELKNAGFLSFFSGKFRKAKRDVASLLSTVSKGDSKEELGAAMDELFALCREYDALALSDYVEGLSRQTDSQLSSLSNALGVFRKIVEKDDQSEGDLIRLFFFEGFRDALQFVSSSDIVLMSWMQIEEDLKATSEMLTAIELEFEALQEAETFLVRKGGDWLLNPHLAFDAASSIIELNSERDQLLSLFGGNVLRACSFDELESLLKSYAELGEQSARICFDVNFSSVRESISSALPLLESLNISFSSIDAARDYSDRVYADRGVLSVLSFMRNLVDNSADRNSFLRLREIRREATDFGLIRFLDEITNSSDDEISVDNFVAAIVHELQTQMEKNFGSELWSFEGGSLQSAREEFQNLDRQIIKLAPDLISETVIFSAEPPPGSAYGKKSDYTESALLRHEVQKKRKSSPHKILKRARGALMELFPCWMMAPTAVAQHLPREQLFDLVIIDEASQMTPENSISALCRANTAFIAGDTNQLPPTNFFRGISVDDDEDEDLNVAEESILELANVQFHPKHRLLWHYRSRHEDLISFSNHFIYDSELVIFPSPYPSKIGMGVSLVEVNGTFNRSINAAEAKVMFDYIVHFMTNSPQRSLGVAVMNQSQRDYLDSLIVREINCNDAVAEYVKRWEVEKDGLESFFIKNLENVQGDERDVIFIGTVYGRDPQGRFYQRFGPINGQSGIRRLNVLFTRAKEQIVTFSSIPVGDFVPSSTSGGAFLLKQWLEYSACGRLSPVNISSMGSGFTESPFEEHVLEAVKSLGYQAEPQIGVSSYFIDIGVKHHSYQYGYICGIECDGASFHSSKSARDRDRLREEVLLGLGWNLYRIWSTDWYRDYAGCRELLKEYLDGKLASLLSTVNSTKIFDKPEGMVSSSVGGSLLVDNFPLGGACLASNEIESSCIAVGSKFSLRYLDGPRAGSSLRFWLQKRTHDPEFKIEGYITVSDTSPIGCAVVGSRKNDIVSYNQGGYELHAQIIDVE